MKNIFLDLRSKEDFANSPLKDVINIPLVDVLRGKLDVLKSLPKDTCIEYYFQLSPFDELMLIIKLNNLGFWNLHNRGNITAKPLIYEYQSTPTIRPMERKEKRTSREIIF